jgi:molybdopterin-containing oxidoreductase family membrane subunit
MTTPASPSRWVQGRHDHASVTTLISHAPLSGRTPAWWWLLFGVGFMGTLLLIFAIVFLLLRGIGIWGVNIPVAWGFAIVNLVWWIGIGHAGTLISAILLLCHQPWRTSINRFAEAMTLFAVANAGLFPLLHLGRVQLFYYILPYPNTLGLWPQWRSPLVWDVFAISTYGTVSLLFWFIGLVPDLATLRDRAQSRWPRWIYGLLALGWRGSARHWQRYQMAYLLLAGLATPLVVSVHSVISFDFAFSIVPGWHTTVFPPYFVAGAVFSGFAMVITLAIPLRRLLQLGDFITDRHLDLMARVMLATGLVVAYGYLMEVFIAWYSANPYEQAIPRLRALGPYAWLYWLLIFCNVIVPQALWARAVRQRPWVLLVIALVINLGMWLERFIIVIVSLARDYLPSSWGLYVPTRWDWFLLIGTMGFFVTLFTLFVRWLPSISIFEVRELLHHEAQTEGEHD